MSNLTSMDLFLTDKMTHSSLATSHITGLVSIIHIATLPSHLACLI